MRLLYITLATCLLSTFTFTTAFAQKKAPEIVSAVKKSYNGSDMSCTTANDAQITVNAKGGTGKLLYSKDNGATYQSGNVFSNLSEGSYQITVIDSKGLKPTVATLVIVFAPFQLKFNVIDKTDAKCDASSDGQITAYAMFGTGSYQFSKDNGAHYQSGNSFNNLQAGTYPLLVKDANGCTASSSVTINTTTTVGGTITSQTNITCGTTTGSVIVKGTGGTSYTYSIDGGNFSFNNTFNNLQQGSHTVTVKEFWGCTTTVPVNIISVLPVATISGTSTICTGSSANFIINISGVPGQNYSVVYKNNNGVKTTVNYLHAGDNPITTDPLSGNSTFSLVSITGSGSCQGAVSGTATVTTIAPGTWLGMNSNWNDGSNWSCGAIPTLYSNVTIPITKNNPVVPSGISGVSNITINNGASLTVLGTLQIGGYIGNKGTFDATKGTLEFTNPAQQGPAGPTAQNISGSWFVNKTINNLKISNSKGLNLYPTLNDTLNITGVLSFVVSNTTFNTNNNLTLKSTANGIASVADMTSNGAYKGNTITGNVTVERYINMGTLRGQHNKAWVMVSTPTQGQSIWQSWMENGNKSVSGYGTQITGKGTGFDAYSAGPALKYYDDATNSWIAVANTQVPVYNPLGYILFVRGDRATTYPNISNTTLRTTGTLQCGTSSPVAVKAGKFQSVGNPYASAVDIRKISATNINPDFIVWDPTLTTGNAYGVGAYQTLYQDGSNYRNLLTSDAYGKAGTINNNIQSGVAFFVQSFNKNGQVYFAENCKATDAGKSSALREQSGADNTIHISTSLSVVNGDGTDFVTDGTMQQFSTDYSNGIDNMDTRKLTNTSENLSIHKQGKDLVIERRNFLTSADTVFYNLTGTTNRNYRFIFNTSGIATMNVTGFIEDTYANTKTPLNSDGDTQLDFTVSSVAASKAANRFHIVFKEMNTMPVTFTSTKANAAKTTISVEWKVENQSNLKQYEVERSADGNYFSKVAVVAAINTSIYNWADENPLPGNNYYRVKSVDLNGKVAYTSVVKAQISGISVSIDIYPNPAIDANANIRFNNQPAGVYYTHLVNQLGQVMVSKKIIRQAGTGTENIEWNKEAASGIYELQITMPDGSTQTFKVFSQGK